MTNKNKDLIQNLFDVVNPNVLLIDDEICNLNSFKSIFRRSANIFLASNKEEAMRIVKNNDIEHVFCDYKMPKHNGAKILKDIVKLYPNIRRTIITGYYSLEAKSEFLLSSNTSDVILKPYTPSDVIVRIDRNYINV